MRGSPQDMASDPSPRPGPECSICSHERRDEFDTAVATKKMSRAEVARLVGCERSTVTRHFKNHVQPALSARTERDMEAVVLDVEKILQDMLARLMTQLEKAEQEDDWRAVRGFIATTLRAVELLAKIKGDLDERPVVNLLISPDWLRVRSVLLGALTPFPDARVAVASALSDLEAERAGTVH